jgi:hypothetical protein
MATISQPTRVRPCAHAVIDAVSLGYSRKRLNTFSGMAEIANITGRQMRRM